VSHAGYLASSGLFTVDELVQKAEHPLRKGMREAQAWLMS